MNKYLIFFSLLVVKPMQQKENFSDEEISVQSVESNSSNNFINSQKNQKKKKQKIIAFIDNLCFLTSLQTTLLNFEETISELFLIVPTYNDNNNDIQSVIKNTSIKKILVYNYVLGDIKKYFMKKDITLKEENNIKNKNIINSLQKLKEKFLNPKNECWTITESFKKNISYFNKEFFKIFPEKHFFMLMDLIANDACSNIFKSSNYSYNIILFLEKKIDNKKLKIENPEDLSLIKVLKKITNNPNSFFFRNEEDKTTLLKTNFFLNVFKKKYSNIINDNDNKDPVSKFNLSVSLKIEELNKC